MNGQIDLSPEILKFGKYSGKSIQEVSEIDFKYILWLLEKGRVETKKVCNLLPLVISYFEQQEKEKQDKINGWKVVENGIHEVTFMGNPNSEVGKSWISEDYNQELLPFANKNYASVQIADDHVLNIIFDEVKYVDGMYPYYMGIIAGKAKRVKNKVFKLNLEIVKTNKNKFSCQQFAIIK